MAKKLLKGRQFKYIKGGMYALNLLVALLGLALGAVGLWIRMDFKAKEYKEILDPVFRLCEEEDTEFNFSINVHMDTIAYFLIFLGTAIIGIGCIGLCGTIKERQVLLGMFTILLFMIFGILLTAGIQAMVKKDTFLNCEKSLKVRLMQAVQLYYTDAHNATFMDQVQKNLACCGAVNGATDYGEKGPPDSCHKVHFSIPCEQSIKDFFQSIVDNMIMILVVSFCIGLFTVMGMGMSAYMFESIRKSKRKL